MKKTLLSSVILGAILSMNAQTNPAITSWLQNTTETSYVWEEGATDLIDSEILANCQQVEYSDDYVYITTAGVPAYPIGPFIGNPFGASDQDEVYKINLNPEQNTSGRLTETSAAGNAVFINGVLWYDYQDGVAWDSDAEALCGGPGNDACDRRGTFDWHRDAVLAERNAFDCSKGHPAMGEYHHHQNPTAFDADKEVLSQICNTYASDGLYVLDSTVHSPLIGFAFDGFPIYGAYGYENVDGTGDIVLIRSSYELTTATTRENGPDVDETYVLGYFREDYLYDEKNATNYLDEHNGRFCITPEYPNGIYAYFATVDDNWNATYPYIVGPTFYGVYEDAYEGAVNEVTTVYVSDVTAVSEVLDETEISVFPNPTSDFIVVQVDGLVRENISVDLIDLKGETISSTKIRKGSTLAYFDTQTLYNGTYIVKISNGSSSVSELIEVVKD